MTEAGPSISFRRREDARVKPTSSGKPALLTDIRIVADDGAPVRDGEVGHILVRGPHTAGAYWRRPAATAETFRDGWLHTGDRGHLDVDGDLCLSGRARDTIITGGENVDPADVEELVLTYPGVRDAAVVGRPDPVWGEVVTAVVVSESDVELDDLRVFLRPHLAAFKVPRRIEKRDALPRSTVGKLLRSRL